MQVVSTPHLTKREYRVAALTSQAFLIVAVVFFVLFLILPDSAFDMAEVVLSLLFCVATLYTLHIFNRLVIERSGFRLLDGPITILSWSVTLLVLASIADNMMAVRNWLMVSNSRFSNAVCTNDSVEFVAFFMMLQLGAGLIWFSYALRQVTAHFPRLGRFLMVSVFVAGLSFTALGLAHLGGDEGRTYAQVLLVSYIAVCTTLSILFLFGKSTTEVNSDADAPVV